MPSSSAVLATIPVGMEPRQVAVAPDGKRAYVSLSDLNSAPARGAVGVIDTGSNTLIATVAAGILPGGVVVAPDGRHAYVPNIQNGGVVSVIDTATNAVIDNITVSVPTSRPLEAASLLTGTSCTCPSTTRARAISEARWLSSTPGKEPSPRTARRVDRTSREVHVIAARP